MKSAYLRSIFFLFYSLSLFAAPPPECTVRIDLPSFHIKGVVNAVGGQTYLQQVDAVIAGAEPIPIARMYSSGASALSWNGGWNFFPHTHFTIYSESAGLIRISEPNGVIVAYEQVSVSDRREFQPKLDDSFVPPIAREISGRTDIRNNRLVMDGYRKARIPYNKATLFLANGGVRIYAVNETTSIPYQKIDFDLEEEVLPNGNRIKYKNKDGRIAIITTHNPSKSKDYASVGIYYDGNDKFEERNFNAFTSDGRVIQYQFWKPGESHLKGYFYLNAINGNVVTESYGFDVGYRKKTEEEVEKKKKKKKSAEEKLASCKKKCREEYEKKVRDRTHELKLFEELDETRGPFISSIKQGEISTLEISYYQPHKNTPKFAPEENLKASESPCGKVMDLKEPVGPNGEMFVTHSFSYSGLCTKVKDLEGNETHYYSGKNYRPERVDFFIDNQLVRREKLVWCEPNPFVRWAGYDVAWHLIIDPTRENSIGRHYEYDQGNVIRDTIYGNLSGDPFSQPFDPENPNREGVETYSVRYEYTKDGFNLPTLREEDSGLKTLYSYKNRTDLLQTKFTCSPEKVLIRQFYQYNDDNFLIEEIIDDGLSLDPQDFTGVTERRIISYKPNEHNFIGEICEKAYDFENHILVIQQRSVFHYKPSTHELEKVEVFDGKDKKLYEQASTYKNWRLESQTDPLGYKTLFDYNTRNQLSFRHKEGGPIETYTHKPTGLVSQMILTDPETKTSREMTYSYNGLLHKTLEVDPYQNATKFKHDYFGNLLTTTHDLSSYKATYDHLGRPKTQTDPKGYETKTRYNARGQPIEIIHPTGLETFKYYLNGRLKEHIDQDQVKTEYKYDILGRITNKKVYDSNDKIYAEEIKIYDSFHLRHEIDACKYTTTYEYDIAGRKKSEIREGRKIEFTYDCYGNLESITQGDLVTITKRDALGQILEKRSELTNGKILEKVTYTYGPQGNIETETRHNEAGDAIYLTKTNAFGEVIEHIDPLNNITTIEYAKSSHSKTTTDPLNRKKIETYNSTGKLAFLERQDRKGNTIALEEYVYDLNGNLETQTSSVFFEGRVLKKIITKWDYGPGDRLKEWTEAFGTPIARTTIYEYTPKGLLKKVTKPDGEVLLYGYDELGYQKTLQNLDLSINYLYVHNHLGCLTSAKDLNMGLETKRKVDPFGNIEKEELANGFVLRKTYNALDLCESLILPDTSLIEKKYDGIHLKEIIRRDLRDMPVYSHQFLEYDLSGNLIKEELPLNSGQVTYEIDALGRFKAVNSPYFAQTIDLFDEVGKVKEMTVRGKKTGFDYDDLGQLIQENEETFGYDSEYNRRKHNGEELEVDDLYQLKKAHQFEFTHDLLGNVETKTTSDGVCAFGYDPLDRLVYFKDAEGIETFYTYDPLHRRIRKRTGNSSTRYLYDGQNEIGFEIDEKFSLRILGDTPFAEIGAAVAFEFGEHVYVPVNDLQGNIAGLYDPIKLSLLDENSYTAFGVETAKSEINPWRYLSKHADEESGLVYFGRRYYDPSVGRWLTTDPKGYTDSMNLYAFALNDPFMLVDPYGLENDLSSMSKAARVGTFEGAVQGFVHPWDSYSSLCGDLSGLVHSTAAWNFSYYSFSWESMDWGQRMRLMSFKAGQIGGLAGAVAMAAPRNIYALGQATWRGAGFIASEIRWGYAYLASRFTYKEVGGGSLRLTAARHVVKESVPVSTEILFGQQSVSAFFSKKGNFKGMAISEVVEKLKNGTISPESLPIDIIVRNGQKITLNNRSYLALKRAGMEPKIIIDRTGIKDYELLLDEHLRGSLPTDMIQIRGGPPGTSLIGPVE